MCRFVPAVILLERCQESFVQERIACALSQWKGLCEISVRNPTVAGVVERLGLGTGRTALTSLARCCKGTEAGSERPVGERVRARLLPL